MDLLEQQADSCRQAADTLRLSNCSITGKADRGYNSERPATNKQFNLQCVSDALLPFVALKGSLIHTPMELLEEQAHSCRQAADTLRR
jgi:hypothetical protein